MVANDAVAPAPLLSVIVLTFNEQANIGECLESVRELSCPVFVVDSGSSDATVDIAQGFGAYVVQHAFDNYAAQRNWSQAHLPILTDWVLHLDADERLTVELVQEILQVLNAPPERTQGFLLRKRTVFMGRWIKHGGHYPAYHLRLFRRDRGVCEDRLYDQHFVVDGPLATLRNDYIDVLTHDLTVWTTRHARWAELEANELMLGKGNGQQVRSTLLGNAVERRRWLRTDLYGRAPLFARAFVYWLYRYILRQGFLDGTEGLIFHFLQGFWFRFLVDSKIYEQRKLRQSPTTRTNVLETARRQ